MKLSLGLAQIAPVLGDFSANMARHLQMIAVAEDAGRQLLVFPELSLTGYHVRDDASRLAVRAEESEPALAPLLEASRSIDLVVSFVEQDRRYRQYITAVYLAGGRILHRHRKVYLPTYGLFDEAKYFAPGASVRAFDTRFGRMAILICEDFWHASTAQLAWLGGADILLLISATVEHGGGTELATADKVDAIIKSYALQLTNFVVHTNRAGEEEGLCYFGSSSVHGPRGMELARGPYAMEALVTADLDLNELAGARADLPLLRDERPSLTAAELNRILKTYD